MTTRQDRPYVDFYKRHKISPVSQDIADLKKHYDRRETLYRRLGIAPAFVRDKTAIEFGPGSGHNALYTYSLQPSRYVLVDGNPTGLKECETLFERYFPGKKRHELVECLIEEFKSDELFDLVICEGLIPAQKGPQPFARNVARFTRPGGVCIVTCHDPVGMLTDLLRCLIGVIVTEEGMSFAKKTDILVAVFEKHLAHLRGMSRPHKDWVVDQIINTSLWRDSHFFSVADAIDALDGECDVYGTSPCFLNDWRWHKDVFGDRRAFNALGKDDYWRHVHNFIDYRTVAAPRSIEDNTGLAVTCDRIWKSIKDYGHRRAKSSIDEIGRAMVPLEAMVRTFSADTADAMADFMKVLKKYPDITPETDWGHFSHWWGRGMQYVSFIRNE